MKTSTVNNLQLQNPHQLSWRIRFGGYLPDRSVRKVDFKSMDASEWLLLACFLVILGLFGTIHCLGWNSHFPSDVEQIYWRVAALTVTAAPVVFNFVPSMTGVLGLWILGCLYICARISLLTLAFLALRDLPLTAYQTPSWTNFIPHL
jgi:hypothetical protein